MESSTGSLNYYQKLSKALAEKQNVKVNLRTISNGLIIQRKKIKIMTANEISKSLFAKYGSKSQEHLNKAQNTQPEKFRNSQPEKQKSQELPKNSQQHKFKEPPEVKQVKRKLDNYLDLPANFFNSFRGPDVTFFKKPKSDLSKAKVGKSDKLVKINETMVTINSSFKPPFSSTPVEKLNQEMVTDPEESISGLNENCNKEDNNEQVFYQKFMGEVASIARNIDHKKFDHMEDPLKTERAHVANVLNMSKVSSQESDKNILEESIQSNNFWKDHNKTIPSTPIISDPVIPDQKQQPLETPIVEFNQNSSKIFSEPHEDTMNLFNNSNEFPSTPTDFFNESQPFNFDLSFGQSPLFPESNENEDKDPLNFLTPINTKQPKFAVQKKKKFQDSPDSIFEETEDKFGDFSLNLNDDEAKLSELDQLDYTFSEFQSPPEVPVQRSQHTQQSKQNQLNLTFEQHSEANTSLSSYKWAPHITREFSTYNPNATISEFGSPENYFEKRNIFKNSFD